MAFIFFACSSDDSGDVAGGSSLSDLPTSIDSKYKSYCYVRLSLIKSGKKIGQAPFYYFSESGKITGTNTYSEGDYIDKINLNMNFSRGWNLVYYGGDNQDYWTTDLPKDNTLEWWLECDNY